ncbi:MAG: type IV pilus modification protein PilV [Thiomonas sp.]|uniref:type IV pilus modification protein PilV n=1 Tax=Thiomonas sp. TaxID=2047785 RepID=UPI002A35BF6B|nr:type IV pilus modification protein PilV [Thiomonas sp.]MDY0331220.1 type IV pilus modification protein PilV [Thiomonas sp.]
MNLPRLKKQGGFSLIEALVALVVISIGLLGIAGMQALGVMQSNQSRLRGLAAFQAASMVSLMRANPAYWQAAGNFSIDPGNPTELTVDAQGSLTGLTAGDCEANTCSPAQMAGWQMQQWGRSLSVLPGGHGTVQCAAPVGGSVACSVTVNWSENRAAAPGSTASTAATEPQNYVLTVTP